jgi:hypothetical protein
VSIAWPFVIACTAAGLGIGIAVEYFMGDTQK